MKTMKNLLSILLIALGFTMNAQITITDKGNYIEFSGGAVNKQFVKPYNIDIKGADIQFTNDFERYQVAFSTIDVPSLGSATLLRDSLLVFDNTTSEADALDLIGANQSVLITTVDDTIVGADTVQLGKVVIAGRDDDDVFRNVRTSRFGDLAVTLSDADLGFHTIVTPGGAAKTATQTHLVGEPFGGAALNTNEWSIDLVGSATQDATGNGELVMATGTTANSIVEIESTDLARFIPANYNTSHHAITIPDGAAYVADNSRKWGAFDATNAATANGIFYELDGGAWYVAHCLNGATTRVEQASWNGLGALSFPDSSIQANVYEIEYNAGSIIFRVNGAVMHRFNLLGMPYAKTIHFPVGMSNTNSGGSILDVELRCRAAAIYTLGQGTGQDGPFYIAGTTAGVIVKTGAGHLGSVIIARNGAGGGDATVSLYDALSATNQIGRIAIDQDLTSEVNYNFTFSTGLYMVITGLGTLGTTITFD